MRVGLKEESVQRTAIIIAVGVALGMSLKDFVQSVFAYVVAPLIAAFIGAVPFELNSFSISGSEFRYAAVIESGVVLLVVAGLAYYVAMPFLRGRVGQSEE